MKLPRLFLIGTGVGRDLRGFEAHIRDLFEHVKGERAYEVYLIKGAGSKDHREIPIANISRKSWLARLLGFLLNKNPYFIHQIIFFIGLIPVLYRYKPIALYMGEPILFNSLYRWRNFSGMQFRMIFYTGGNTVPLKMRPDDFLQLVTPVLVPLALQRGVLTEQMCVLPHFINATCESWPGPALTHSALREKLGIPRDRAVILSVGAIDSSVKRMDYLIREVSCLTLSYFLIVLGEFEWETSAIKKLAEEKLGKDNFHLARVSRKELTQFYQAADIFVLPSLKEGFGLVTIEAMLHGLPVLVHHHAVAQFVLAEMASYSDFSKESSLTKLIEKAIQEIHDSVASEKRKKYVIDRFSWVTLANNYRLMLSKAVDNSAQKKMGS